jgi:hypothetical protein
MNNHDVLDNGQILAEQLFCTRGAYQKLSGKISRAQGTNKQGIVLFNDLIQLVRGSQYLSFNERVPELMQSINQNLSLRRSYLQLLQTFKFAECDQQAAASSCLAIEELPARVTDKFSVKFKRDKDYPSQVYVILTIEHPAQRHHNNVVALHIAQDDNVDCIYFPSLSDGRSQLLMDDSDSTFNFLIDANSQLFVI